MSGEKIRLFLDLPIAKGQTIPMNADQAHYLFGVMRRKVGDRLLIFNGLDGEWRAEIVEAGKRKGSVQATQQTKPQAQPADIWLLFAPLKKARTDMAIEKSVELGVSRIVPVITQYTNSERVRIDRLRAQAIEASEQCGAVHVPEISEPLKLDRLLDTWDDHRALIFCDEASVGTATKELPPSPAAVLIGPEGGFSEHEREKIIGCPNTHSVSLGPRILRAETAALAVLTLWQAQSGDW